MTLLTNRTPRQDGFHLPAEYEKHAGCWMAWPERRDIWYKNAEPAQKAFTEVAKAISKFEPVTMCVNRQYEKARIMLPDTIKVVEMSYNDAWMRDIGPTFVIDGREVRGIDWNFNSWGGILPSWELDNQVAQKVLNIEKLKRYKCDLILEGGGIHVDGEGTLLTIKECLLDTKRNPNINKINVERILKDYLNVSKIIWLGKGIFADTVHHVDNLCCFVRPGVIALTWTDDEEDSQFPISFDAYQLLQRSTDAKGRKFKIIKIHQPNPIYYTKEECRTLSSFNGKKFYKPGDRMPSSYINFYIANGGIIMPGFNDAIYDRKAYNMIQELFPDREVIQIYSRNILLGGGNIHCITLQQPKVH